jgi:hypothetical protein
MWKIKDDKDFNKNLLKFLKEDFKDIVKKSLQENRLYREYSLQCLLYSELAKKISVKKYLYPEIWYWIHKADLVILNESFATYREEYKKNDITLKNKTFNIDYCEDNSCETLIELKYSCSRNALIKSLKGDFSALNNKGCKKWLQNKINNKYLIFIYENFNNAPIEIKNIIWNMTTNINIIGYSWDWEELELIEN